MSVLMTSAILKDFLPTTKKKIPTTLTDTLIKRVQAEIFDRLNFSIVNGEETVIRWVTQNPSLADVSLPCKVEAIVQVYEAVQRVLVDSEGYRLQSQNLIRVPGGFYYPNTFDNVNFGIGQYWVAPVEVHFIPAQTYVELMRGVITDLVIMELAKMGKFGQNQFDNLSGERIKDQQKSWTVQNPLTYENYRKTIMGRLFRHGRIGT